MQALQDLSKLFLEQAVTTDGKYWEEDEASKPTANAIRSPTIQAKPMSVPSATRI